MTMLEFTEMLDDLRAVERLRNLPGNTEEEYIGYVQRAWKMRHELIEAFEEGAE